MLSYVVPTPETSPPPPPPQQQQLQQQQQHHHYTASLSSSSSSSLTSSLASPLSIACANVHQNGVHVVVSPLPQRNSFGLSLNLTTATNSNINVSNSNSNSSSSNSNRNCSNSNNTINEGNNSKLLLLPLLTETATETEENIDNILLSNMNSGAAAQSSLDMMNDERAHLLSNPTPPPSSQSPQLSSNQIATTATIEAAAAAAAIVAAPSPPIMTTTTIITPLPPGHPPNPSRSRPNSIIVSDMNVLTAAATNTNINTNTKTNNNNNNNRNNSNNSNNNNNSTSSSNSSNNIKYSRISTTNNNNTNTGGSGNGGSVVMITASSTGSVTHTTAVDYDADDLSEEAGNALETLIDSDISDKQQQEQEQQEQFPSRQTNNKKPKLSKLGSKTVGLKRVSFGSSKGSMVETLVFETPTPLSEHVEPSFGFDMLTTTPTDSIPTGTMTTITKSGSGLMPVVYTKLNMDDSGIEVQEESERSIVRVSIYQSSQPQQIYPPEYLTRFDDLNIDNSFSSYNCNLDYMTTAAGATQASSNIGTLETATMMPGYDRQQSTDSGWDNPFRPGGDLSREADEIVNMIRGGKPITPTEDHSIGNGNAQRSEVIGESATKTNFTQNQSAQNGTNSHKVQSSSTLAGTGTGGSGGGGGAVEGSKTDNKGITSLAQVSKQVVPGPTSASHVVIDEKKNKKKGCCVVQ